MHSILRENADEVRVFTVKHGATCLLQGREHYGRKVRVAIECDGEDQGHRCDGMSEEKLVVCSDGPDSAYGNHIEVLAVCRKCGAHLWAIVQLYEIISVANVDAEKKIVETDERAYNEAMAAWTRRSLIRRAWDWLRGKKFNSPAKLWNPKNVFVSENMHGLYYVVSVQCSEDGCFGFTNSITIVADQDNLVEEVGTCSICGKTNFTWIRIERARPQC